MRRARQDWQKEQRLDAILAAAEALFAAGGGEMPTVAAIAARTDLAKGTIYLYFASKEEIFIALLRRRFAAWMEHIEQLLGAAKALEPAVLADAVLAYPLAHPVTLQLASMSQAVLEQNLGTEAALAYKRDLAKRVARLAEALGKRGAPSARAALRRRLVASYAALLGLWQLATPPPRIAKLLKEKEFAVLNVDFKTAARELLEALWTTPVGR